MEMLGPTEDYLKESIFIQILHVKAFGSQYFCYGKKPFTDWSHRVKKRIIGSQNSDPNQIIKDFYFRESFLEKVDSRIIQTFSDKILQIYMIR